MVNPALKQSLGIGEDRKRRESNMILERRGSVIGVSPRLELKSSAVPTVVKISTNS